LAKIVIDSLRYIRQNHWIKIYAYVIMPNHIHLIVKCLEGHRPSEVLRDFKKFTSKEIVEELRRRQDQPLLRPFKTAASSPERQTYKVWEDGYFDKSVYSESFLFQKMRYIHNNPVYDRWGLVDKPEQYEYSSAKNYLLGEHSVLEIDHYSELLDDPQRGQDQGFGRTGGKNPVPRFAGQSAGLQIPPQREATSRWIHVLTFSKDAIQGALAGLHTAPLRGIRQSKGD